LYYVRAFHCFPLLLPLLFIALAPAAFTSSFQCLALQIRPISHCRSIVIFWEAESDEQGRGAGQNRVAKSIRVGNRA
jgi:hypothetical protein